MAPPVPDGPPPPSVLPPRVRRDDPPEGVSRENGIEFVTIEWVRELARQAHQTTYKLYNVYIIQGL